ncbi:MAG TPA: hypothetical protein VGJ21_20920 [Terracidiphilus sp.]|jgi:hypothetical protein
MKALLFSLLIASATLLVADDDPSIVGKWQIHSSISGNDFEMVCTFAQKEKALTGNCASDRGTFDITGSVAGNKVTWSYKSEYNGTPLTVNYEGVLASAKITGNVNIPEFNAGGDFSAAPSTAK